MTEIVETEKIVVADHFPMVRKQCKRQAAEFFHCFSTEGQQILVRSSTGAIALKKCRDKMKAYDACMEKALGNK